jgi:hypothetical protein
MKDIKDLGEKEVIWCKNTEECEKIANLLHSERFKWGDGDPYKSYRVWLSTYNEVFCFYPNDGTYCSLDYFKSQGFVIYEAKDFLKETPKQLYNEVKEELQSIISEWHESKVQKPLIEIIREHLNE